MTELYAKNKDFHEYVDKYCIVHKCTPEEACTHKIVQSIALIYNTIKQKRSEGGYDGH